MKYNYKPSLRDLHFSIKYRLKEFFLENTLHGVPYFVDPTRPKWERITWFLLTVASIIATIAIIVIIWDKFQTEPTITGLDIMTEHINIEFPQIFLCFDWAQLNHSRLHEPLKEIYEISIAVDAASRNLIYADRIDVIEFHPLMKDEIYMYKQLYNWFWGKSIDLEMFETIFEHTYNLQKTFKMMAPDCNDIISNCVYRGTKEPCSKLFTNVIVSVGACCKFNTLEPLKNMDFPWNLQFETASSSFPWRLYLTQNIDLSPKPGERPLVKAYFPIDIEFIVDITYTTPDIRYLTLRQRECYYKQEGVSFNDCEINCLIKHLFSHCNCLPWFLSFTDKTECSLEKYSCLNDSSIDMNQCNCWLSCDHTSYSVKGILKSQQNVNRIILKNWPTALYKREMRFGYMDLLVSFGGIASLFLGYSLLVSVEMGYYFSLRTYCGAVIQSSRKKYNIITVRVVGKLPHKVGTDVHPEYYQYLD